MLLLNLLIWWNAWHLEDGIFIFDYIITADGSLRPNEVI